MAVTTPPMAGSYSARTISMACVVAVLGVRGLAATSLHRLHRAAA
ncbi:hypothetical protein [Microbispora bryophytorum]|nr:hypothetical protein [Microbispora bryophytorum]